MTLYRTARLRWVVVAAAGLPSMVRAQAPSAARMLSDSRSRLIGSDALANHASAAARSTGTSRSQVFGLNAHPYRAFRSSLRSGAPRSVTTSTGVTVASASTVDRLDLAARVGLLVSM